jgi:4-aminobutyrate aminotransferase-like enzyme
MVAGILVEPIQGVGGFITPPKEYFELVAEIIRKHGGVFISDEVQTGFGRTGKMWGIQQYGVEPDMITAAKGIANGLPLAAVIATGPIADSLTKNTISTFGGNPVCCAAANATIGVILRDKLVENAQAMGAILHDGLISLQQKYSKVIGDVRGMGLMLAIELVVDETSQDRTPNPEAASQLMEETKQRGLLLGRGGLYGNAMRIAPALNIKPGEVEEAIRILDDSFAAMAA